MKPINLKQLYWTPGKGEHRISVNASKVNLKKVWEFAEARGLQPELVAIEYSNRIEIHIMLICQTLPEGTVLGYEYDELIDQLQDIDVPDDAVRHCYGGRMATLAHPA